MKWDYGLDAHPSRATILHMKHPNRSLNIHKDLCLCGSGRLMRDCCLFVRCNTTPPSPIRGYAHPSCFARALNNCDKIITGEHYISKSVLNIFQGTEATVSGMTWLPKNTQKTVPIATLVGNMLCKRHNEALSSLDALAAKFFGFYMAEWSNSNDDVDICLVRGFDLERWFLKMMCGLVASGNATHKGKPFSSWTPPLSWLDILFGTADIVNPSGLHAVVGQFNVMSASFTATVATKETTSEPIAIAFSTEGILFLLAMEALPPKNSPGNTRTETFYRPMAVQLNRSHQVREAHFGWPNGEVVSINMRSGK